MGNVTITRALLRKQRTGTGRQATPRGGKRTWRTFDWADTLAFQIEQTGLPAPKRNLCLVPPRKFETDLAWPDRKLFIECDGAAWAQGQHGRGQGMQDDCTKWNALTLQGWRGLRFTGEQVKSGYALTTIAQALERYPVIGAP